MGISEFQPQCSITGQKKTHNKHRTYNDLRVKMNSQQCSFLHQFLCFFSSAVLSSILLSFQFIYTCKTKAIL